MELFGYLSAILIGLSLGLTGSGGSMLTIPVLVYFFHINPWLATSYSLFIVGITSAMGTMVQLKKGNVSTRIALWFSLPSLVVVFIMRRYIMPHIPDLLLQWHNIKITKPVLLMVIFGILMVIVAYSMLKKPNRIKQVTLQDKKNSVPLIITQGTVVGLITGFIGIGGGFLIIPSLVLIGNFSMRKAVGTSLLIITMSALPGVVGDLLNRIWIDYVFIGIFCLFSMMGMIVGIYLSGKIPETRLRPVFGWLVLGTGIFTLAKQFIG